MPRFVLCCLLLVYVLCIKSTCPVPIEEDLRLTRAEKLALDKFKAQVKDWLTHEYMHEDIYLIRWLRARNLNIRDAKSMLKQNLQWRAKNKMDTILEEDFGIIPKKFAFWLDGRDKDGRPVGSADISTWDPRPYILSGKGPEVMRYAISVLEDGVRMVRQDQKEGKNVTQFTLLANMDGFNLYQHACAGCIPLYINFLLDYENHYPGILHKLYFINTPRAFETLLNIVKPALSKATQNALEIFGTHKPTWKKAILAQIDSDQIRPQFGGTRVDPVDELDILEN